MRNFVLLLLFVCGCDVLGDEKSVEISYRLNGEGGVSSVAYLDKGGEMVTLSAQSLPWEYSFKVEEGSQLLYLRAQRSQSGVVSGIIKGDGEILKEFQIGQHKSGGISAWGRDENIPLRYLFVSGHTGESFFMSTSGLDSLSVADFSLREGPLYIQSQTINVGAGFEAQAYLQGEGIDSGDSCIYVGILYEPEQGNELTLISEQRCNTDPHLVGIAADVPGY